MSSRFDTPSPNPAPTPVIHPPSPASHNGVFQPDHMADIRRTWHAVIEKSWIIGFTLALALALGVTFIRRAPVLYASTATIQVERGQDRIFKAENMRVEDLQSLDFLQTVAQSLKARPLLARVALSNNLPANPQFMARPEGQPGDAQILKKLDDITAVKLRRGTRLIDITVTHSAPSLTADIANGLVDEYINDNAERHVSSTEIVSGSLIKEADRLKKKLEESEQALQKYKEKQTNASSLDDRQNLVVDALKNLSARVTEAKFQHIKAESDYSQALQLRSNINALLTMTVVANNPIVVSSLQSVSRAEEDFAALKQRYKEKHPKFIQAVSQLAVLKSDLTNTVLKSVEMLKAGVEAALASQTALEQALRVQEASALELGGLAIQYTVLSREVESDRALYDSVLSRMKETSVTKEMQPTKIRVVQPAYQPESPVSPNKMRIMAASAVAGLFIGFLVIMVLNFLDTSIKTVDEMESLLKLPVLSTVSHLKEVKKTKHPLVVAEDAKSSGAEAFRTLRTALSMLGREEDRRVFLLTSSMPQEGKTFCSLNYSASLAQMGLKTLLIDGDLRRPTVESSLLGKDTDSPGVTDFLTGRKSFTEVVRPAGLEKLFFISGGTTAPNPAELLAKDALGGLIAEALKEYDRVVVDSAPIHAVSDTLLMLKNVQTVCLVVRAARTSSRSVQRCVQLLKGAHAPLSGVIMNQMPIHRGVGYGYYYYNTYYDYHYHGKYSKKGVYGATK